MATDDQWCILRTSPGRTVSLATSLQKAGFDAWTPVQVVTRRRPRSHKTFERDLPVAPTFVFARAHHLHDLVAITADPISKHPQFSLFKYAGRIPLVADKDIGGFRDEHERDRARREADALRRLKRQKKTFAVGQLVKVKEGVAAGMTGVIEQGKGKDPLVNFGGGWVVKVSSWLLNLEEVEQTGIQNASLPRAA